MFLSLIGSGFSGRKLAGISGLGYRFS